MTVSSIDYAIGTLAYNPVKKTLFIVGHDWQSAIAEYKVPTPGFQTVVGELPSAGPPVQDFTEFLDRMNNPSELNRITGMLYRAGSLIVNAENWYDACGCATDTTFVVKDANNMANSDVIGYFKMNGAANSAGYMGSIPSHLQKDFKAKFYTGWSSVYSIISRYSLGPSLWTFNARGLLKRSSNGKPKVASRARMNYAYKGPGGAHLSKGALNWAEQGTPGPFPKADPLWNPLSQGVYGFFIPKSRTFAVIGNNAGLKTGIGYKAVQENGCECPGPCPYGVDDYYNYYWLFDVDDILKPKPVYAHKPYAHGTWDVPFSNNGMNRIIGATLDDTSGTLYVALGNAGQLGEYDRPPLIVTYSFNT
eukprot:CAMPEP_0172487938 /NCGR_PEP_ID=MMETSP1066-20121228/17238_1 /TAXON_ID=671091 /ORGANISM="Coscinodiscus wailesii, Strain CCMP2513" /LENGTH=362 /DNA_ID=CAMNT_0013254853 /DNA_START=429 /DNA_END=1517 /DNA_ORIENTATION=-